jgi:hypothetical protein
MSLINACEYTTYALYDYDGDTRNRRHKGKHSYKYKEKMIIMYIKEKKELQREEQKMNPLIRFNNNIHLNDEQSNRYKK